MTIPIERTRSLSSTRDFLRRLLSPYGDGIKRVPLEVRSMARALLKHFPSDSEIRRAAERSPDVFGKPEEP